MACCAVAPQLDRQEAELRAEQRRIQIERANKILFDETDRVKAFHGKMLLSDVLAENTQLQVRPHGRAQHIEFCVCVLAALLMR